METKTYTKYACSTCRAEYDKEEHAKECEAKPVSQDKGVKVGDTIRIIKGDGKGLAVVESRYIVTKDWGHYAWERYWHTVALTAKCVDSWGHRQLTFDDYEVVA